MSKTIRETGSGIICHTSNEIAQDLEVAHTEWQETRQAKCELKNIEQYLRKKLTEILNSL